MAALPRPRFSSRPMCEEDLSQVLYIENLNYPFPWSPGIFKECLSVGYDCRVYLLEEEVVAYSILSLAAGECHLLNISVSQDLQGQGMGRSIMHYLFKSAAARDAQLMILEVRPSNVIAHQLYLSLGFEKIGVRKAYYPAYYGREDAYVLARNLMWSV